MPMLKVKETKGFEKDFKKCIKRGYNHSKLSDIVNLIALNLNLPTRCRPHKLSGEYSGYWECHIEPDWLLIYLIEDGVLKLVRTGTHSDLFK